MRILIVNQHPLDVIGGSEIQCDLIANGLTQRGHEVTYYAVNGRRTGYPTPYRVVIGELTRSAITRVAAEFQPQIVYWRYNKRRFLVSMLAFRRLCVPVVFAISHQNDVLKWGHKVKYNATAWREKAAWFRNVWRPALSSRLNHFGFRFVAGSVAQLQQQTGYLPVKRETVIANSVDASALPFTWERPFVIWAASVKASKNPEQFWELARSLQEMPVDFLMVGEIIHHRYREQIVQAEAELPNFHYLGVKTYRELNGMIRQARVSAHTCEPEGFPNVMIQSWMQGTPTVSLHYDPDHMIEQYQLGYFSKTFEQFRQDVQTLLTNGVLRKEISQRAVQFVQKRFRLDENIRKLEIFLEELRRE